MRLARIVHLHPGRKEATMFIALAAVLAVAWILGFTVMHVASGAIHILIVLAAISLILHFVRGRGAKI